MAELYVMRFFFIPRERMLTFYLLDVIVNKVFLGFVRFSQSIFFNIEHISNLLQLALFPLSSDF